jgi:hypothetical protein
VPFGIVRRTRTPSYTRIFGDDASSIASISLPITETWTHADATDNLDADYDWSSIVAGWDIVSNTASLTNSGGSTRIERLNVDLQTSDFRVRAPVSTFPTDRAGTQVIGVFCRMPSDNSITGYSCALLCVDAGPITLFLSRWVSGVRTDLASLILPSISLPTDLAVSAKGNVIGGWWAGLRRLRVIDALIPSGAYGGIEGVAQTATNTIAFSQATFETVPASFVPLDLGLSPLTGVH